MARKAWLISPEMTVNTPDGVKVIFETIFRRFNDQVFLRIGTDTANLAAWESIELFVETDVFESVGHPLGDPFLNPQPAEVDITDAIAAFGSNTFRIAFQYVSNASTVEVGNGFWV